MPPGRCAGLGADPCGCVLGVADEAAVEQGRLAPTQQEQAGVGKRPALSGPPGQEPLGVEHHGHLERGEYSPSLQLALRLAGFFGPPVEAIFSLALFSPLSEQLYRGGPTAAAREASA